MYHFVLADDHPLYREAIKNLLLQHWPAATCSEVANMQQLHQLLTTALEVDLLLLDLKMPDSEGLAGLLQLKQRHPQLAIAMLSAEDDKNTVLQAMAIGAVAYISKSAERLELLNAVEQILQGQIYLPANSFRAPSSQPTVSPLVADNLHLTRQQQRVLKQLLHGQTNREIAAALFIAETTVKSHISALFEKFGVQNRLQLMHQAAKLFDAKEH